MGHKWRDWSEIDIEIIKLFSSDNGVIEGDLLELAGLFSVNYSSLLTHVYRLRQKGIIKGYVSGHKLWSAGEERTLFRTIGRSNTVRRVGGRSELSQKSKLAREGVDILSTGYSLVHIAEALGVSRTTVLNYTKPTLTRNTLLYGQNNGIKGSGKRWLISEVNVHIFLCNNTSIWSKHECPGILWIVGMLYAVDLCTQHGHRTPPLPNKQYNHSKPFIDYSRPDRFK